MRARFRHLFRSVRPGAAGEAPLEPGDLAHQLFVADDGERIVGIVDVRVKRSDGNPLLLARTFGYVTQLSVAEDARGRGAGRALLEAAAAWARERGCASIELGVYEFNESALALYRSLGYETLSRRMSLRL